MYISTEAPKSKKQKVAEKLGATVVTGNRLPEPCPLPILSDKTKEVLTRGIKGNKFFLLREAVTFYEGLCPKPTNEEYIAMAIS